MTKYDSDLFYTCNLIEFIGRNRCQKRSDIVKMLGPETISRIYHNASVAKIFHLFC